MNYESIFERLKKPPQDDNTYPVNLDIASLPRRGIHTHTRE